MKRCLVAPMFVFIPFLSIAQDDIGRSTWMATSVKIDGRAQEWNQPLRYYDSNTKLFFAFANDGENLFICFQTNDEMSQMKIMRAGMEVALTTRGKHKGSISFPVAPAKEEPLPAAADENSRQQNFNRANMRSTFLAQHTTLQAKGFTITNGLIPVNDTSGINAALNWDETNKLTYEIAIPLKELFGTNYTEADIQKNIALDVKINALTKQNRSEGSGNGYSGRGGGGRTGGGEGRMGGGGGMNRNREGNGEEGNAGQRSGDRTAMFEKSELKEKFVLAQNTSPK